MTSRERALFYILIITLFASGATLLLLRIIGNDYRQQLWLATQETLPIHHIKVPESTTTPASVSGWRTYKNTQYNFQFSYPDGYCTGPGGAEFGYLIVSSICPFNLDTVRGDYYKTFLVLELPYKLLANQTTQNYAKNIYPGHDVKVGLLPYKNIMAYKISEIPNSDETYIDYSPGSNYLVFNKSTETIYNFHGSYQQQDVPNFIDFIFSTFKFTK